MKNYLAFDLGASSGRAIIGHYNGETIELEELHRFANGPHEVNGQLFWDINTLFAEIKEGLRKAIAACPQIDGIGIDTWGVDVCYLGSDGKLIGLPHHYRDPRTSDVMPWTFARISKDEIYRETGIQFMNLNTIFQLSASVRDDEEALKKADKLLFIPNALTSAGRSPPNTPSPQHPSSSTQPRETGPGRSSTPSDSSEASSRKSPPRARWQANSLKKSKGNSPAGQSR